MYQMKIRVRYSEIDAKKKVDMAQIVKYFQDCSTFHSEDVGCGIFQLEELKKVWFLCAWQIEVERYPVFGETLTIETWPYDRNDLYAYRNFVMIDENGHQIAKANSIWFLVDTKTEKPVRITEEDVQMYGIGKPLPMEYKGRKIKVPKEMKECDTFPILRAHIDTNNHVNNSQYVMFAQEYLPKGFVIERMRADYKKAAKLHDEIFPKVWVEEGSCIVELCDQNQKPYVVVEFQGSLS